MIFVHPFLGRQQKEEAASSPAQGETEVAWWSSRVLASRSRSQRQPLLRPGCGGSPAGFQESCRLCGGQAGGTARGRGGLTHGLLDRPLLGGASEAVTVRLATRPCGLGDIGQGRGTFAACPGWQGLTGGRTSLGHWHQAARKKDRLFGTEGEGVLFLWPRRVTALRGGRACV